MPIAPVPACYLPECSWERVQSSLRGSVKWKGAESCPKPMGKLMLRVTESWFQQAAEHKESLGHGNPGLTTF